ncbi:MAG: transcription-repair coupling factor, partial [Blautia sp.]|nr:transcription-repair coupling factor [Blautia sp.]
IEAQGLPKEESFDTTVDLAVSAFIPETYVSNEYLKLNLYKRFALIESQAEYDELYDELLDRFGEPPLPVMNLLKVALLRAKAHKVYVTDVKQKGREVNLFLYENAKLDVSRIPAFLNRYRWELSFIKDGKPRFVFSPKREIFGAVVELVDDMCESLLPQ